MRTSKEERADLRARCRAGVIAITTDAALVAALLDDVEELGAELAEAIDDRKAARDDAARAAALLAVRTAERDARPEITAEAATHLRRIEWNLLDCECPRCEDTRDALRAHAGKVAR